MIHPNTNLQFISPQIGFGVVATHFIPKGTITWAADPLDQIFTPKRLHKLEPVFQNIVDTYSYRDNAGNFILCWDHSRFVNHSFLSNCISTAYNFEIAVRDIIAGEELTDDYGYLNLTEPFNCIPEAGSSRKQALPDDLLNFYPFWDEQLRQAFAVFNNVEQPLAGLIEKRNQKKVYEVSHNPLLMDSILQCYYSSSKSISESPFKSNMNGILTSDKTA
ncbi:MAG: SET domain-containing protein [Flavobacterium sp.]|nr:SET domain-containing protein [Pedobacter sp.]